MAGEAVERERRGIDAGALGEALLERGAIAVVEAEVAREPNDRVVDDRVRCDQDRARDIDPGACVGE